LKLKRLTIVAILFSLRNPTVVSMIVELETKASDHNCNPFLSEKFNPCCNDFLLEFEEKRTIVAILFYLKNPTVAAMIFCLNLKEN